MDHLGNAKESEDFYEIDKTLLRSRTQNIELNGANITLDTT